MLRSWRKRMYLWYCAVAYGSFLLVFLGVSSSGWSEERTDSSSAQWGLLAYCLHDYKDSRHDCAALDFGSLPVWFDVARVFVGLSVALLFAVSPVAVYLYYHDDRREDVLLLTVFGVVTAILGLLGAILYGALREADQGALSWGFAVYVTGHVVAAVLFVTLCLLHHCLPKRKPVVRPFYM